MSLRTFLGPPLARESLVGDPSAPQNQKPGLMPEFLVLLGLNRGEPSGRWRVTDAPLSDTKKLAAGDLLGDAVWAAASVGEECAGYTDDFAIGVDLGETCEGCVVRPWIANGHNNSTGR